MSTPSSPVGSTVQQNDVVGGSTTDFITTGSAGSITDMGNMRPLNPSAFRAKAKASGGEADAQCSQLPSNSHHHHHHRFQQHQQLCCDGFLNPLFLAEIDENVQSPNGRVATTVSHASFSGSGARFHEKDSPSCSPHMKGQPLVRGRVVCTSRSARGLHRRPHHRCMSMSIGVKKDEELGSRRTPRQPLSSPSSSRRGTAYCLVSGDVPLPSFDVASTDKAIPPAMGTAISAEPELGCKGTRSRSLLPAWITACESPLGKAGVAPMGSGMGGRNVEELLASSQSIRYPRSQPSRNNGDIFKEERHVLELTLLSSGKEDSFPASANPSTVSMHAREAEGGAVEHAERPTPRAETNVEGPKNALASLIVRLVPISTTSPHTGSPGEDNASETELRQRYPLLLLPSFRAEESCALKGDVIDGHDGDTHANGNLTPILMEDANQRRGTLTSALSLRAFTSKAHTQDTVSSTRSLTATPWLCGCPATGTLLSTTLWRTALLSKPPPRITPCLCVSTRTEQLSLHASSRVASRAAAMRPWVAERGGASLESTYAVSAPTSGYLCAVPPLLVTASTGLLEPSISPEAPLSLVDDTAGSPARVGNVGRTPSCPTAATESAVSGKPCDVWQLRRCYAHFERAVEQRGRGGVWSAGGFTPPLAWTSRGPVSADDAAVADAAQSPSSDNGACSFIPFTRDAPPGGMPGAPELVSPLSTSVSFFSPASAVLRAEEEEEEEIFASAAMWALEQMGRTL
ncbi:hypothetical protein JKF63_07491 [Porcisia hertigi]|uniref:Uncharacterized protein n=1 Tax=Porcisia hertigi TaxID=2761500 RepID=A0A836IX98_9TRYP|nr:hypothetical protein JKF63_07491 [Porcisia hertigi]